MKKEDLILSGISTEVAEFVFSKNRNNKALNNEGLEIGNQVTILGISEKVAEDIIDGQLKKWVNVETVGDKSSLSVARLVGTPKRAKYFNKERKDTEFAPDFDKAQLLTLPQREGEAIKEIVENHKGKTYAVVAIAKHCGQYDQTFYLFAEIKD